MIGICRKMVAQTQSLWQRKREKRIAVPEVLIEFVGRRAHELNEKSGGKEGGRIVRKLITDLIESRIQNEADRRPEEYKQCAAIRLELESIRNGDEESRAIPRFRIEFGC